MAPNEDSTRGAARAAATSAASHAALRATISPGGREETPITLTVPELVQKARTIRRHIVTMTYRANSGHPGGSLSATEIVTTLYFRMLRHNPKDTKWPDRDRFILSKAHACPVLYAALAECGYFPVEELGTFRRINSRLQGHAHIMTPGVEMSGGSLGQGLSFGIGTALAARLDGRPTRAYVLLGDGECDEGQVWEAAMAAPHFQLDNLCAIVDRNRIQNDRFTSEAMEVEPLADKWRAFRWHVLEVNGHSIPELLAAFEQAKQVKGRPTMIIAHTVKGKGVSFMENNPDFHGRAPTKDEYEQAMKELA